MKVEFELNGEVVEVEGRPMDRLLDLLRENFGLTGSKEGCGEGECGACTVLMDGEPVLSCLVPLMQCGGASIQSVEGVVEGRQEFVDRFVESGGVQCGACTPGIVVTAAALLDRNPEPTRRQVEAALAGNLCRCTGYEGIHRALVDTEKA